MSCESESESFRLDKDSLSSEKTINNEEARSTEAQPKPNKGQGRPLPLPLESIIALGTDGQFEEALGRISEAIKQGSELIGNKVLHYRLMRLYFHSYKLLDGREGQQEYILFLLSLLAQILRQNSAIRLPFSKKTVLSLMSFDEQHLTQTKARPQIIRILMVLCENMARQGKLMVRLGVQQQLKRGLLFLVGKVDEYSTLQISLRTLLELQAKAKVTISIEELEESGMMPKVRDNFGDGAASKIRSILCRPKVRRIQTVSNMTLLQLVSGK